jgi:ribosomal protein S20
MESAEEANSALPELYAVLDRAAQRRIIQPNAAARQKARVARHVLSLTQE